jgi:hypothetical protein
MAIREFKDASGREWRAWDVVPADFSARTNDEDFLATLYYTGWIAFETTDGSDRRRLYPIPKGWSEVSDTDLAGLLGKAEVVGRKEARPEKRQ